jgi:GT2 family glycosyltransferase
VENALIDNPYSTASEHISQFVYDYNRSKALEPFFTTNNIALATDLFREVGGFTTAIPSATAEDKEFCDRWRAHGLPLAHVPSAVVHHAHELTFTQFVRQHFNYGRGTLVFRLIRRHRTNSAFVPEPTKFYLDLLLSPMNRATGTSSVGRWRLMTLLAVSQVATFAGLLREALTRPQFASTASSPPRLDHR